MDRYKFVRHLKKHGYKELGHGCYAVVYGKHDSEKVVKVGFQLDEWLRYVLWAINSGYAGIHAPKVDSFKVYDGGRSKFYVAVMERLYELEDEADCLMEQLVRGESFIQLDENTPKEWVGFTKDLYAEFSGGFDMHDENWMQRKNGELVLTDPIGRSDRSNSVPRRYTSSGKRLMKV